jgi:hypothetical protein
MLFFYPCGFTQVILSKLNSTFKKLTVFFGTCDYNNLKKRGKIYSKEANNVEYMQVLSGE